MAVCTPYGGLKASDGLIPYGGLLHNLEVPFRGQIPIRGCFFDWLSPLTEKVWSLLGSVQNGTLPIPALPKRSSPSRKCKVKIALQKNLKSEFYPT